MNTMPLRPEQRLMLAVLEGAIADVQKYANEARGPGARLFAEAEDWFGARVEAPVAFDAVCDGLGLDPSWVLSTLRRWCESRGCEPGLLSRTVPRRAE